jgi:hypothetical protein
MPHSAQLGTASVSVDLDPLRCYHDIHALPPVEPSLQDVILRRALPRFLELFSQHGIRATFFVVGRDLSQPGSDEGRALLKRAVAQGHELGNHSHGHLYDLARLPRHRIEREIGDCHQALLDLTGQAPVGFRGPGYEVSGPLFDVLEAFGYRYDSSIFPCPPYYLAKAAILAKMKLLRQPSGAILGSPRALPAPTQPYRPDSQQPFRPGNSPVLEIPIGVTPLLRLPAIGTSLLLPTPLLSGAMRSLILLGMRRQPFFNFELHGMDLLGADEDNIPEPLRSTQPDLRTPLAKRVATLDRLLATLCHERQVLPLCELAPRYT